MKRDIANAPVRGKAAVRTCALSDAKEPSHETKADKERGFLSPAIHRATRFAARSGAAVA